MTIDRYAASVVAGSVTVVETGTYIIDGNQVQVPIGNGLEIQTGLLHEVCFTEVSPLSRDLSVVLGAVKCADRSIHRQHARGWARRINLSVPVYELATWRSESVTSSLVDALQYLTGDLWQVQFVRRRRKSSNLGQAPLLESPNRRRAFVPFSDGLDSFAQSELLRSRDSELDVIPVHLRSSSIESTMKSLGRAAKRKLTAVPVSAHVNEPKHAELSFRSRPFLYDGLAAYAAALSAGGDVIVPENGQGSLGGSLVRLGAEAPHRSCHPGFTTRLGWFFEQLTGEKVTFVHPALFQTKGQVLRELAQVRPDSEVWLRAHSSCSYDSRHSNRNGRQVHCGVCGNCLLRRVSVHAAGIVDPTSYKFGDLHAKKLEDALAADDKARTLGAYKDIARNAARSMQRLANMLSPDERYRVAAEIDGLARYQKRAVSEVREAVDSMLEQHGHEWAGFLDYTGKSSWVAQFARG